MKTNKKSVEPIPEEFASYDEAAKFWDTHDTTDYLDVSRPVTVASEFRGRYYEIKIEAGVAQVLRTRARQRGVMPSHLASDLLRQQLVGLK
jgi:hypothetical protein